MIFLLRLVVEWRWLSCFLTKMTLVHAWALLREISYGHEFHTGMTFWFCIVFTWWWVISYFGYLKVHFMLINYTRVPLKIAHITHVLPVPVHQQTDFTLKLVVIFVFTWYSFKLEQNSRAGTTTRVNCADAKVATGSSEHPLKVSNTSIIICSLVQYLLVILIGNLDVKLLG